jgi:hypothetical protein
MKPSPLSLRAKLAWLVVVLVLLALVALFVWLSDGQHAPPV